MNKAILQLQLTLPSPGVVLGALTTAWQTLQNNKTKKQ